MGGYGSGRYADTYDFTIEDCLRIDVNWLKRGGYLKTGCHISSTLHWSQNGRPIGSIGFESRLDLNPPYVRLHYTWDKTEQISYQVHLTRTRPNYGGVRWWFVCPGMRCGRRIGKLYKPPDSKYFLCRTCQHLTYTSCRESHQFDAHYALLARNVGTTPEIVRHLLSGKGRG